MAKLETKNCAWCGKVFMPTHWKQRFCCEECRITARKDSVKKTNAKHYANLKKQANKKKCLICGKTFTTNRGDVVTCSPYCQEMRRREQRKEYKRMRREEAKKKANQPKTLSIAEFDRKAQEMGMSYGHYELYLRMNRREKKNVV